MKIIIIRYYVLIVLLFTIMSCKEGNITIPEIEPLPEDEILYLPVVVHVLHNGEEIGEGPNMSEDRILRQIEIINEDFRRKAGTRGYNTNPHSSDSKIEFVLAKQSPSGEPTTGIVRFDISQKEVPNLGYSQNHFAQYSYWRPESYINIWTTPLPEEAECLALGVSTGPKTDLPGGEYLSVPQTGDSDGILINWIHFGETEIDCHARYGRTLTHELGHYLGLLHPWGKKDCEDNDYCDDTPAVDSEVYGNKSYLGCRGEEVMIENYMNYSDDIVMNVFTNDQIYRMQYVLKNSRNRTSLLTSPGLKSP